MATVSGDRTETAQAVARELSFTTMHVQVSPTEYVRIVSAARADGKIVAMVGDGLKEVQAGAHVGIAIGSGTEMSLKRRLTLFWCKGGIASLPIALRLARRTLRTIWQNMVWAFIHNVIGIPLAAVVLLPVTGWSLSPIVASVAMALSSVSVLANSLRLRAALRQR